jgi:hypothetical protein
MHLCHQQIIIACYIKVTAAPAMVSHQLNFTGFSEFYLGYWENLSFRYT